MFEVYEDINESATLFDQARFTRKELTRLRADFINRPDREISVFGSCAIYKFKIGWLTHEFNQKKIASLTE